MWEAPMKANVNGFTMNYEITGPQGSPAVVLHHPLATNLTTWDELTAVLSPRYRVVRLDARGHGQSEATKGAYALDTLAQDVVSLLDTLGLKRVHFLGLSMGGMVGQYLGVQHGERFASLVLASTSSRIPDEAQPIWDQRIAGAKAGGMKSQLEGALGRWVSPAGLKDAALVARLSTMIEATPVDGYLGWCEAIRRLNVTDRLGSIKVPTRVIVGELDQGTPVAAAQTIHKAIPGSEIAIVPGVSHMLQNENPAAFNAEVIPFIDKHAKR
jgi:3-oxoadipate enol-lactonase